MDTSVSPHSFSLVPRHLPDFPDRNNPTLEQKGAWRPAGSTSPHFAGEDSEGQRQERATQAARGVTAGRG